MTDREIVEKLLARDERVTKEFFFVKCRPLIFGILKKVFDFEANYDELVASLYEYLMEKDGAKLRSFKFQCELIWWLRIVASHFFVAKRDEVIEKSSDETLYEGKDEDQSYEESTAADDLERLLELMPNKRYVNVIRRHILEGRSSEEMAQEMHVTIKYFYNIKKRAMAQLTRVALNDIKKYGK